MFQWFIQLPPGEQLALLLQISGWIFGLGVYVATVRFLAKEVKEVKETTKEHGEKLEKHGEEIAALKASHE